MNPVFRKDILSLLRLKRVAAIQIFFIGVLAMLVITTWPQSGVMGGTVAMEGQTGARAAQDQLLLGLIIGQIVLLVLFVPGIAAVSLSGEREANTLEMLYASRLSAAQIIIGKVLSAIGYPLLLLISGLPFVALLNFRGEVDYQTLTWAYLILVVSAIFLAMVSLTISSICKQSATALVISYVLVLVLCGGVLVPAAIMLEGQEGTNAQILHYLQSLSPVAAAMSLIRPHMEKFNGEAHGLATAWRVFMPLAAGFTVLCFFTLIWRLHRPPTSAEAYGAGGAVGANERSLARKLMYLIDDKKKREPMGTFNPLLTKERRTNNLRGGRWMIRIFYGALFISLGLAVMSLYGGTEHTDLLGYVATVLVAFEVAIVALVSPSLTSSSVSTELEYGTFETLRLTPLSAGQIFWGKFIPSFLPALLPLLALLPGYSAICFINQDYIAVLRQLLPVLVMAVAFCLTLGLMCSCFTNNTARATVSAYLITAVFFVLPLFAWWGAGNQLEAKLAYRLTLPSPLVMAMNLLPTPSASREIANLWPYHMIFMAGLCIVMLIVSRIRLGYLLRQG
jgi:ABC-type transport system involved in multi-copper enzyme maturation permease subunit